MYPFRITTNGVLRSYRSNLTTSRTALNDSMQRVMTGRAFTSYAEDPAAASKAFQLRRSIWRAEDQLDNTNSIISRHQVGFTALKEVVDGDVDNPGLDGIASSLAVITGDAGAGRFALGQDLLSKADSIVQSMNVKYGDDFVFAGSDGLNVPFTWQDDGKGGKTLMFRGIDVSSGGMEAKTLADFQYIEAQDANGKQLEFPTYAAADYSTTQRQDSNNNPLFDEAGQPIYEPNPGATPLAGGAVVKAYRMNPNQQADFNKYDAAYQQDQANYKKLQEMSKEATYVDIGIGMKEDANGKIISSSAYNSALSGLNFLGFGTDEDGVSKNLVEVMRELGTICNRCDPDTGDYLDENGNKDSSMEERANLLAGKLREAIGYTSEQHVRLSADQDYLKKNVTLLTESRDQMDERRESIEAVDPALAIEEMGWAQKCYNAALRIGSTILSQSLLDYMN